MCLSSPLPMVVKDHHLEMGWLVLRPPLVLVLWVQVALAVWEQAVLEKVVLEQALWLEEVVGEV